MTSRLYPLLAAILAVGLIAAGCGGSDDDGGDPAPAESGESAEDGGAEAPGDDAEAEVEQVVRDYMRATATGDGETGCALIREEVLTDDWEDATGESITCPELFEMLAELNQDETIDVGGNQVHADEVEGVELEVQVAANGESASVTTEGEAEAIELERADGDWIITGFEGDAS